MWGDLNGFQRASGPAPDLASGRAGAIGASFGPSAAPADTGQLAVARATPNGLSRPAKLPSMRNAAEQRTPGVGTHVAVAVCSAAASSVAVALAACSFALPAAQAAAGRTIELQLTPAGAFRPSDGRKMPVDAWRIDAAIAGRVIERFRGRRNGLVLDYEHQTLRAEENGQPAPAAGWLRDLTWREGSGLWATVELTQRAADYIAQGEYRFVSPVFAYDAKTGEVLAITMAAITNDPAIDGMAPLELRAAATYGFTTQDSHEEHAMNPLMLAVLAALSLDQATTEEEAIAALSAVKPRLETLPKIGEQLGVGAEEIGDGTPLVAACTSLRQSATAAEPDPAKYVPIEAVESLRTGLAALRAENTERQVRELVEAGVADGRLDEALKPWATDLGKKDVAALRSYLDKAQPIAALRGTQTGGRPPSGANDENGLSPNEIAVCKATGVDPKEFAAAKKAQPAAAA